MPRHRHPHHPPHPHHEEFEGDFGPPPPPHARNGRRHLPPHLRDRANLPWMDGRQRQLLSEILDRPEEAEAAADVLAEAPPEFAALSALVLGVYEKLSRAAV